MHFLFIYFITRFHLSDKRIYIAFTALYLDNHAMRKAHYRLSILTYLSCLFTQFIRTVGIFHINCTIFYNYSITAALITLNNNRRIFVKRKHIDNISVYLHNCCNTILFHNKINNQKCCCTYNNQCRYQHYISFNLLFFQMSFSPKY